MASVICPSNWAAIALLLLCMVSPAKSETGDWSEFWRDLPETSQHRRLLDKAYLGLKSDRLTIDLAARAEAILGAMLAARRLSPSAPRNQVLQAGRAWMFLGELRGAQQKHQAMLDAEIRGMALIEQALPEDAPERASVLASHALSLIALNRNNEALDFQLKALSIVEQVRGLDHPDVAPMLNNLAIIYSNLSRHSDALLIRKRTLKIFEDTYGRNSANAATAAENLGITYADLGRLDEALALKQQALAIREDIHGSKDYYTGLSQTNLAATLSDLGKHDEARILLDKALVIFEHEGGPNHLMVAYSLNRLAENLLLSQKYGMADAHFHRAQEIFRTLQTAEHPEVISSLLGLAESRYQQGDNVTAIDLLQQAVLIAERIEAPAKRVSSHQKLADVLHASGQPELAIYHGKRAINTLQEIRSELRSLDRETQKTYIAQYQNFYERLAGWLIDAGRLGEAQQVLAMLKDQEQYEYNRRSLGPEATVGRTDFVGPELALAQEELALTSESRAIWSRLGRLEEHLRRLREKAPEASLPLPDEQERQRLRVALRALNNRYAVFVQKLASTLRDKKVDVQDLQRLADSSNDFRLILGNLRRSSRLETALIQYVVTDQALYILAHTADHSQPIMVALPATELHRQIRALRDALLNPRLDSLQPAQALYRHLIAPVESILDDHGTQHMMVSMTGALRYLPLAALHDGKHYLIERYSLSTFSETVTSQLKDIPGAWSFTGFGLTHPVGGFVALPGVREELLGVKAAAGLDGSIFFDNEFTDSRLFSALETQTTPVLHIASHFSLSPGDDSRSFLALGDGQQLSLARMSELPFEGLDLLILSACETGLDGGSDATGREIESLGALVQKRGAKGVIATLWKVEDRSTAHLMQRFYTLRQQQKLSKAEALRRAQMEMIAGSQVSTGSDNRSASRLIVHSPSSGASLSNGFRHPHYWAPFILMGNWL